MREKRHKYFVRNFETGIHNKAINTIIELLQWRRGVGIRNDELHKRLGRRKGSKNLDELKKGDDCCYRRISSSKEYNDHTIDL